MKPLALWGTLLPNLIVACQNAPNRSEATDRTGTNTTASIAPTKPASAALGAPTNRVLDVDLPLRRWPPHLPDAQAIASFLNHFIQPALGADEAIAPLGARRVAIRANPASQAYADTLLATLREQHEPIQLEFRLIELDETDYRRAIPRSGGGSNLVRLHAHPQHEQLWSNVLDRSQIHRTISPLLHPCLAHRQDDGEMLSYIEDYAVHIGNSSARCTPIVAQVLDGTVLSAQAAQLPSGAIGLAFHFEHGEVQRPIPEVKKDPIGLGVLPIQQPIATMDQVEDAIELLPGERVLYSLSSSGASGAMRRRLLSVCVR